MNLLAVLTVLAGSTLGTGPADRGAKVRPGVDVLINNGFLPLAGKRVGLITNPTGVTADLRSTADVLHKTETVNLIALFGPEHGVRGDVYAGGHVRDGKDPRTGLPVYSLFGKTRRPTSDMLQGLDTLVFDIQDIGSRSYTYISTLALAMEAAAESGVSFLVLDRPNPLGGLRIEGRPLDVRFRSFVGHLPIPYVHGLTVGELAQMINGEGWLPGKAQCDLHVVPVEGWRREMLFEDTGLVWVPTSPHVPRAESAAFYAATGILGELRVLSEGVGYTLPFETLAAPWLDGEALAAALNKREWPGVHFRPTRYQPYYATHVGEACAGVQIHLIDPRQAPLTEIQFYAMDFVRRGHPDTPLFGNRRDGMFDKVCGTDKVRRMFQDGTPIDEIIEFWRDGLNEFRKRRAKYLLYE